MHWLCGRVKSQHDCLIAEGNRPGGAPGDALTGGVAHDDLQRLQFLHRELVLNKNGVQALAEMLKTQARQARFCNVGDQALRMTELTPLVDEPRIREWDELTAMIKKAGAEYQAGIGAVADAIDRAAQIAAVVSATQAKNDEAQALLHELKIRSELDRPTP